MKTSFFFLNITQFLGAMNDNIYKLLIVFLLINVKGSQFTNIILSKTGAIFVVPFLLFSAAAGVLADRISKRNILVAMKAAELVIMTLSVLAIYLRSETGVYVLLFLMASQSALFGPSKYGVIPEIVKTEKVPRANGILAALTFLAIIIGTFFASFITDITNKNFVLASVFCVLIAFVGLAASLKIEKTEAKKSKKKINPLFFVEIYRTLKLSYKRKFLLPSILSAGFFLFSGGFIQLNTIPFAMQSLNLTEVGGGYLFLSTSVGIAAGALIAGKLSKNGVELGIACLAGLCNAFLLFLIGFFPNNLIFSIIILMLLGMFGGMFLIPFESFLQVKSPEKRRGQIIACANFMSFFGVLAASFMLFAISELLGLSAASGFLILGFITLVFNLINAGRLSELFIPYVVNKILSHFFEIELETIPSKNSLIVINRSWARAFCLFAKIENLQIITLGRKFRDFPYVNAFCTSISIVSNNNNTNPITKIKKLINKPTLKDSFFSVFLNNEKDEKIINQLDEFDSIVFLKTKKERVEKKIFGIKIKKTVYKAYFEEKPMAIS